MRRMKRVRRISSREDIFVDTIVYIVITFVFLVTLYPFYYSLVISFNNGIDAARGGIFLWPRQFTFDNYKAVFSNDQLLGAFFISVSRTVIGTIASLIATSVFAYGLSHKKLLFRKFYFSLLIISMYFTGGIIPYFILLNNLKLTNSYLVYIIPSLITAWYAILFVNFFQSIPEALKESAKIDGANDLVIFGKIIVPLSTPIFATIALYMGVYHWNDWYSTAFFTQNKRLRTLAYILIDLINRSDLTSILRGGTTQKDVAIAMQTFTPETIRMATMMVVVIPIVCVYPFLQKYFVKGIMVGSIK
ncbi:MAG TPA: carbohydrate ABC transporter permease [Clostridiaceae bacterium]|nr:carbohydrate ABC transporter permease [Clostridiaceae bacterium]